MNEVIFIAVVFISLAVVLLAFRLGKSWLFMIPPVYLIFANIFAPQLSSFFGIITSLALPLYAAIFLATDLIAEHWGKKLATRVVWIGFLAQLLLVVISQLILRIEVIDISLDFQESLMVVFGYTPRIVLGSLAAYLISQHYDIWSFHLLRRMTKNKYLWLRNNLSTMTSQFIDSSIFVFIAFYGVVPYIVELILGVWFLKVCVALLDTPFIYLSYVLLKKKPEKEHTHFPL